MTSREVTCTCKDKDGNITCLGGSWGQVDKDQAMDDIDNGTHEYWVPGRGGTKVQVHVVPNHAPPYLRTDPDDTTANNLDELDDC